MTDLPLLCTETSYITSWDNAPDTPEHRIKQAEYADYLRAVMSSGEQLKAPEMIMWYSWSGDWRKASLFTDGKPNPSYYAWQGDK